MHHRSVSPVPALLALMVALLLTGCGGGGGGSDPLRGTAEIPFPQEEDLLMGSELDRSELVVPANSFQFPVTLEFTTSAPDGSTGPNGEPILRFAELSVTSVAPAQGGNGQDGGGQNGQAGNEAQGRTTLQDDQQQNVPDPDEVELSGSVTIRFELATDFPAGVQLPVFRYSELNQRFVDDGLTAEQVQDGDFAEVSVSELGRYALGQPPEAVVPPDRPEPPQIISRTTRKTGLRWSSPPEGVGVNLYRGDMAGLNFTRINSEPFTDQTTFFDTTEEAGAVTYRITHQRLREDPEDDPGPESVPSETVTAEAVSPDLAFVLGRGNFNFEGELFPAVGEDGSFWLAVPESRRLFKFDRDGRVVQIFGPDGDLPVFRTGPLTPNTFDRGWYLARHSGTRVHLVRPDLSGVLSFGGEGDGQGDFQHVSGLTTLGDRLIVADSERDVLQEFTPNGVFKRTFGNSTSSGMAVSDPHQIIPGPEGGLLVADAGNDRIAQFDSELAFGSSIAPRGPAGNPLLQQPTGVALEDDGDLWISSTGTDRLVHLNSSGELIEQFGAPGSETGEFRGASPGHLAYDPRTGYLLIADPGNGRVLVFRT